MENIKHCILFLLMLFPISLSMSCGGQESTDNKIVQEQEQKKETALMADTNTTDKVLLERISGIYHGIQEEYTMKNKFGDDMIIGGKTIVVPSSDHKIILKPDETIDIQQTSLADNSRYYLKGKYEITLQTDSLVELACHVSDGPNSKVEYTIVINTISNSGKCSGFKQPDFEIQKMK